MDKCDMYAYAPIMMSQLEYKKHCIMQRESQVTNMGKAISKVKNMSAQELLKFCGQENSVPVDLKAILKTVGISALPKDFSPIENKSKSDVKILGALVAIDEDAVIFYNKNDLEDGHRYRFTIAHELGHCCLSHSCLDSPDGIHIELRMEGNSILPEEKAANTFAGELLIPYDSLMKVIDELILPSVRVLADIFAVSENVMLARLEHLNVARNIIGYNY